jgi:hypothetical protein
MTQQTCTHRNPSRRSLGQTTGVDWVKRHGDGHPVTRNAQTLKLGHLIDRWNGVAGGAECLPREVWKILPVQPVGTVRAVSVILEKHGGSHLYKRCNTCHDSKESNMSNGAKSGSRE